MVKKRRRHSAACKFRIALEALKATATRLKGLWDRSGKKHRCINCHFLSKIQFGHAVPWDDKDRSERWARNRGEYYSAEINPFGQSSEIESVGCHKDIWWIGEYDEYFTYSEKPLMQEIMSDRAEQCFFVQYHAPMGYATAEELFRVRYDTRQLKRSLKWTIIGLFVAALSSLMSIGLQIYNTFWKISTPTG